MKKEIKKQNKTNPCRVEILKKVKEKKEMLWGQQMNLIVLFKTNTKARGFSFCIKQKH